MLQREIERERVQHANALEEQKRITTFRVHLDDHENQEHDRNDEIAESELSIEAENSTQVQDHDTTEVIPRIVTAQRTTVQNVSTDSGIESIDDERMTKESDGMKKESFPWTVIWCCSTAVVVILIMSLLFCVYYRCREQKYNEEIVRLQRPKEIDRNNRSLDTLYDAERGHIEGERRKSSIVSDAKSAVRNTLPSKYGESFDVMVENMNGVQGVLMDGIVEEMVTEGEEGGDELNDEGYELPTSALVV